MLTRRTLCATLFAASLGSCAWLTGTRRRGRRRGRRRAKRDPQPTANNQEPQISVEALEVGDTLLLDEEEEEFVVLALSSDGARALLRDQAGRQRWVGVARQG